MAGRPGSLGLLEALEMSKRRYEASQSAKPKEPPKSFAEVVAGLNQGAQDAAFGLTDFVGGEAERLKNNWVGLKDIGAGLGKQTSLEDALASLGTGPARVGQGWTRPDLQTQREGLGQIGSGALDASLLMPAAAPVLKGAGRVAEGIGSATKGAVKNAARYTGRRVSAFADGFDSYRMDYPNLAGNAGLGALLGGLAGAAHGPEMGLLGATAGGAVFSGPFAANRLLTKLGNAAAAAGDVPPLTGSGFRWRRDKIANLLPQPAYAKSAKDADELAEVLRSLRAKNITPEPQPISGNLPSSPNQLNMGFGFGGKDGEKPLLSALMDAFKGKPKESPLDQFTPPKSLDDIFTGGAPRGPRELTGGSQNPAGMDGSAFNLNTPEVPYDPAKGFQGLDAKFVADKNARTLSEALAKRAKPAGYDDWSPEWRAAYDKGLDMSPEAIRMRAAEQGFEGPFYHGMPRPMSGDNFRTASPREKGFFASSDPQTADHYAADGGNLINGGPDFAYDEGAAVYPVMIRNGQKFGGPEAEIVARDPANIRSTAAAFDPANIGKPTLLGSGFAFEGKAKPPGYNDWAPEWRAAYDKGLPMDTASRMQRAREQGFNVDMPVYHGSPYDIQGEMRPTEYGGMADVGVYFSTDPAYASRYAWNDGSMGPIKNGESPNVMKAFVRGPLNDKPHGRNNEIFYELVGSKNPEDWKKYSQQELTDFFHQADAKARAELRQIYAGNTTLDGSEIAIFDPANIRSTSAAFDPANIGKANLLGANAATQEFDLIKTLMHLGLLGGITGAAGYANQQAHEQGRVPAGQ